VDAITEKHKNHATIITTEKLKQQGEPKLYSIDSDGDIVKTNMIPIDVSRKIQSERCSKSMTRKELALKLNVKENVITELENAKYVFDKTLIRKIEKVLSCKIL